jgi:hypothetical protein
MRLQAQSSGDTESALVRGTAKPDVWSPAGSFWGRLANLQADTRYTADDNPSIVRTPLVIAMEGSFVSDSPFMVLDAPWVTSEKRDAAAKLQRFLAEKVTPELAGHSSRAARSCCPSPRC